MPRRGEWLASSALTAEMRIRVRRKTVYIPVDSTVADALHTAGYRDLQHLLPHLQVWRIYHNTHIPIRWNHPAAGLLTLRLIGGDEIRW